MLLLQKNLKLKQGTRKVVSAAAAAAITFTVVGMLLLLLYWGTPARPPYARLSTVKEHTGLVGVVKFYIYRVLNINYLQK